MLLNLINLKLKLSNLTQFKLAIQTVDDICDGVDKQDLRKIIVDEFCTGLLDQTVLDVTPAFEYASKEFIQQYGKRLISSVCERYDAHSVKCLEHIVATALDTNQKARESLSAEFKLLYQAVKFKQGDLKMFNEMMSVVGSSGSVSTRFYRGLFEYLWPDALLGK